MIRRRRGDEIVPRDFWSPYGRNAESLLDEMDRLFDDFRMGFEDFVIAPRQPSDILRTPAVDLLDNGKELILNAEVPGIKKEDIEIEVGDRAIEISAESKDERSEENEDEGYLRRERRYSKLYRKLPLPEPVQSDGVTAELKDGVLTVRMPKTTKDEKKAKKIEVK